MALVFAAVLPHSPLLVPNIGKEHTAQFALTLEAAKKMEQALEATTADSIIVLTTKGPAREEGFFLNIAPEFKANFEPFGDLVTAWNYSGDVILGGWLRERLEMVESINLVTDTGLDYASAIPLSLLNIGSAKPALPISLGQTALEKDFAFGKLLQKYILESDKKIAVIASADFSHRVTKKSPIGYSPKGKKFDQKIVEALKNLDSASLLNMKTAAEDAACEDLPVLATLLGILDDVGCSPELFSYEAPFGVGHALLHYRFGSQSPL